MLTVLFFPKSPVAPVRDISGNGELSVLSNDIGVEGRIYQVVIDYMNSDVANEDIYIAQYDINGDQVPIDREGDVNSTYRISSTYRAKINEADIDVLNPHTRQFTVPVFVGTGLRMTANVRILKGSVNLTSIGAIALAAEAGRIEGSLVVQTLGIAGQQVAGLLPLPSELNTTRGRRRKGKLSYVKASDPPLMTFEKPHFGMDKAALARASAIACISA